VTISLYKFTFTITITIEPTEDHCWLHECSYIHYCNLNDSRFKLLLKPTKINNVTDIQ